VELKEYNHRVARAALKDSKWQSLMHLWDTCPTTFNQHVGFGGLKGKPVDLKKILKLDKKIPEGFILGAIVHDRFLNKKQLQELATMPGLESQLGQLCSILASPASKTAGLLARNPQILSQNLDQYVKDQKEKNT